MDLCKDTFILGRITSFTHINNVHLSRKIIIAAGRIEQVVVGGRTCAINFKTRLLTHSYFHYIPT